MMKQSHDPEADALSVWFAPWGTKASETREVAPGVLLDVDAEGQVIGIEVLDVSRRMAQKPAAAA